LDHENVLISAQCTLGKIPPERTVFIKHYKL